MMLSASRLKDGEFVLTFENPRIEKENLDPVLQMRCDVKMVFYDITLSRKELLCLHGLVGELLK